MEARIENPALTVPNALPALMALGAAAKQGGVPLKTLHLVYLRASQINGCSVCIEMHARDARKEGESTERLFAVAGWHDAPYFSEAERAALALTEAATRLADRTDAVPDQVWRRAREHYDEAALSTLTLNIALINFWNRINVTTRQIAGSDLRRPPSST